MAQTVGYVCLLAPADATGGSPEEAHFREWHSRILEETIDSVREKCHLWERGTEVPERLTSSTWMDGAGPQKNATVGEAAMARAKAKSEVRGW